MAGHTTLYISYATDSSNIAIKYQEKDIQSEAFTLIFVTRIIDLKSNTVIAFFLKGGQKQTNLEHLQRT